MCEMCCYSATIVNLTYHSQCFGTCIALHGGLSPNIRNWHGLDMTFRNLQRVWGVYVGVCVWVCACVGVVGCVRVCVCGCACVGGCG
jgi:hypothetical protein